MPPTQCVLEVISNRPRQVLFCRHPYCLFMVKLVASTQMIARHFSEDHPDHELIVCDICNFHIDPAERFEHNCGHMNYESRGECIDSVVPQINPADSSLDFVNISLLAPDDSFLENDLNIPPPRCGLRLAPTPPYRLPSTQSPTSETASPPVPPTASISSGTSSNLVIGSNIGGFLDLFPMMPFSSVQPHQPFVFHHRQLFPTRQFASLRWLIPGEFTKVVYVSHCFCLLLQFSHPFSSICCSN